MCFISDHISLQNIKLKDQPKLMELMEHIYPPAYKHLWANEDCNFYLNKCYSFKNLEVELAQSNAAYYFVNYNAKRVGIFRVVYNKVYSGFPEMKATYINRIYLGKEAQGKGVAKALFKWLENEAKKNKNILLWLEAMDTQKQAIRFYEKQNFKYGEATQLDFKLMHPHLRGMYSMYKVIT